MLKWLEWVKEIQAISQAGLAYTKDVYDQERFEQLRALSISIMQEYTEAGEDKIRTLFASETGYQTPKVDVRAVIFQDGKLLLVREKADGAWALPGGWADIGLSPSEVAVKEVQEEAGYEVRAVRLLAVLDKKFHRHPPSPFHVYKMFIQCEITGGLRASAQKRRRSASLNVTRFPHCLKSEIRPSSWTVCFAITIIPIFRSGWINLVLERRAGA